ncbi:MAG TPA: DNA-binding transcriptional regulator Fis [Gammaproteobacteria bacterium]|jgi:Fis family transcriptional regulator, factor for inversion stimulation protein|nr:DNA-binding transcriptional regulator Fis [Pseudomonadota bacterium]HAY47272.1 DNA-binding transcriptional regulator Fis [Gammaproteobacteria bacterium]
MAKTTVSDTVRRSVKRYFNDLDGQAPTGLYAMVLAEMEKPLLQVVMKKAGGNQTVASAMLGINRNTLRKKLKQYELS